MYWCRINILMSTTSIPECNLITGLNVIRRHAYTCQNVISVEKPVGVFFVGDAANAFDEDAELWVCGEGELATRQMLETLHNVKCR